MYEQLIFSNDFEPSMKSIKHRAYEATKDILIQKPFVFGKYLPYLSNALFVTLTIRYAEFRYSKRSRYDSVCGSDKKMRIPTLLHKQLELPWLVSPILSIDR